jgi:nicotinamide riboside kinase
MAEGARCIAIVGAESSGKTTLAQDLAERLRQRGAGRVAWVPEVLREWCERSGRTPLAHEQGALLRAQHERIAAACATHDWVVCDTTGLMTAVYSTLIFGDSSLQARAAELHRRSITATLLTALDLPWVADGHLRDGPHVQGPVDALLRSLLQRHGIAFQVVGGQGERRLDQAWQAMQPWLAPREGLFAGLSAAAAPGLQSQRRWRCECCVPEYERRSLEPRNGS